MSGHDDKRDDLDGGTEPSATTAGGPKDEARDGASQAEASGSEPTGEADQVTEKVAGRPVVEDGVGALAATGPEGPGDEGGAKDPASQPHDGPKAGTLDQVLPVLPLRNSVLFPGALMPLAVGRPKTLRLLSAVGQGGIIAIVSQHEKETEEPSPEDLYPVGCSARVLRIHRDDSETLHVVVQGLERIRCHSFVQTEPYLIARVEPSPVPDEQSVEIAALSRTVKEMAKEIVELVPELPSGAAELVAQIDSPTRLAYVLMTHLSVPVKDKQAVLEHDDVESALRKALEVVNSQLEVLRVSKRISSEVKGELNKNQREFFLRQQLKAIRKELGDEGDEEDFVETMHQRLLEAGLPPEGEKAANKELKRLHHVQPTSPEYNVIRTYLEWLVDLPWQVMSEDNHDIAHARTVLERDHYGLEKVKKRMLEFLAVNALRGDGKSPILCLVGPPGVGKTSLGKSVAEALGRKYQRVALGGVRDEAEIRGHRRTYIGAMPGKFIQIIKRAETRNPVVILDEVDKIGRDWRGDPTSALLEVLDPEQNGTFMDHYIDVPFDLSRVMFIATANQLDGIPGPLRDRMEIIEVPGYTVFEKHEIAKRHLVPKQIREHGLQPTQLAITNEALDKIIVHYTREAGVRGLERKLAEICRGVAVGVVEGRWNEHEVGEDEVSELLGPEIFIPEAAERTELPGIATGLAWTAAGGAILFVEATRMPGGGKLRLTGSLGDVMKESVELALSYLRSKAADFGIEDRVFKDNDLHVHVPAGAIPKDGPSAGVTMVVALTSLLTNHRVHGDLAMTGEISLRGQVLPVGGIKEKVLAAHRSGIRRVLLPERNRKDLPDIPEAVRDDMEIRFISRIDEAVTYALAPPVTTEADPLPPNVGLA